MSSYMVLKLELLTLLVAFGFSSMSSYMVLKHYI